jgi:hypothetical protein
LNGVKFAQYPKGRSRAPGLFGDWTIAQSNALPNVAVSPHQSKLLSISFVKTNYEKCRTAGRNRSLERQTVHQIALTQGEK